VRVYFDDFMLEHYSFGPDHPTKVERAENALRLIRERYGLEPDVQPMRIPDPGELCEMHTSGYVLSVLDGECPEWPGSDVDMATACAKIAGAGIDAAEAIISGEVDKIFSPMGCKHHAHRDRASGFCVFNDAALAAKKFVDAGMKVLYLDWDAHHGDGVEALTRDMPEVMTASIHQSPLFPWTGLEHDAERHVFNYPLAPGSDGTHLRRAVTEALDTATKFGPDVIILAAGADGHTSDPLAQLRFETEDFEAVATELRGFSDEHCEGRIYIGGAGGYDAEGSTPRVYAAVYAALDEKP
jgi:acetoin utilization protein AcuC